jgi:hypothetical protein
MSMKNTRRTQVRPDPGSLTGGSGWSNRYGAQSQLIRLLGSCTGQVLGRLG